jgi:hypothetical protein
MVKYFDRSFRAMKSWNIRDLNVGVANGAEIDLTIAEDFSKNDLVTFLRKFADEDGELGGNIVTGKFILNCLL